MKIRRKYGETIEEILEYAEQTGKKLHDLENSDIRNEELELLISNETAHLTKLCAQLTAIRQESAGRFAAEIVANLSDLAMDKTRFEISMEPIEPGPKGAERIEFLIAPNPGEPLKPLSKIASGGEISRVMLAIKSAMAKREPLPTMVFDEIDVGVGGRTAFVVADKLAGLGGNSQVICITHLGQIASRANSHFYIEKSISGDRTSVSVVELNREQRVEEIVRMLGGDPQSQAIRQHAAEMLQGR